MNIDKLENKLNEIKKNYKADKEVWMKIPKFLNYEVSNFGRIKSLETVERRKCPTNGKILKYIRKESILKPLYIGKNRRWIATRLVIKQTKYKQISLAKILLSTFLKISIDKLPRAIHYIDGNSHNLNLNNLSFIYISKKDRK